MENKEIKTCSGCENVEGQEEQHSLAWEMIKELSKTMKRQTVIIFVILGLWFTSIVGFVWYINQYDYSSCEVQQDGEWGNTFIDGGNEGDITYGADNTSSQADIEEPQESKG